MAQTTLVNMLKLIGAVVVIVSQIPVECHAANTFEIKKLNCTLSPTYFNKANSECGLKVEDGRNKYAGGHAELIKAIDDDVVVGIQVYMGSKLVDGHFSLLFNFTENVCDMVEEAKKTTLAAIVRPLWEQYTNIPFGCPFAAGEYHVKDLDYNSIGQMIPITILGGRYKIDIKTYHKNELIMKVSALMQITATSSKKQRSIN